MFVDKHEQPMGKFTFQRLDVKTFEHLNSEYTKKAYSPKSPFRWIGDSISQMKSVGGFVGVYNDYPKYSLIEYESKKYLMQNLANGQEIVGVEKEVKSE